MEHQLPLSWQLMKVCIDIQPAVSQRAGIGRYTSELAANLPTNGDLEFDLFYFDFKGKANPPRIKTGNLKRFSLFPGSLAQQAWKYIGWPRFDAIAGDADLYHFTNFIIPPLSSSCKSIVSIHDISFMLHPEFTEARNLSYLRRHIGPTVERANAIITISQRSADDIHSHLNVPKDKIYQA